MGRFFPHADLTDIVSNMRVADNASYNATFTYPEGGAIEYVKALASATRQGGIALGEGLLSVDLEKKIGEDHGARDPLRAPRLERPVPQVRRRCRLDHDPATWNKVLVFNLGFDRKGKKGVHWAYYPSKRTAFYRIGWYDNIFDTDRMSLYVEIGFPAGAAIDVPAMRARVLADLEREGVTSGHRLVAEHSVVMDPAYVHITQRSLSEHARLTAKLKARGVWSLGRYGGWTYCSIEDNIVEARALVSSWNS